MPSNRQVRNIVTRTPLPSLNIDIDAQVKQAKAAILSEDKKVYSRNFATSCFYAWWEVD